MPRAIAVTVAVMTISAIGAVVAAPEAEAAPGACRDANGVTVVVDFGDLGGGVEVGCAPGDPASGFAALRGAGFSVDGVSRAPSFLCRINGRPGSDPCVVPPPPWAYWSYWIADRGGPWCYSDAGMLGRDPQRGTVEGWSFVSGSGAGAVHAPRSGTFSSVPGAGSTGRDCDAATTATTTPTTRPPSTRPPSTRPPSTRPPSTAGPAPVPAGPGAPTRPTAPRGSTAPGTTGAPASGAPGGAPQPDGRGGGGADTGADVDAATTTPADSSTTSTEKPTSSTTSEKGDSDGDPADRDDGEALSTVELADSGRSGPGSPFGVGIGVGAIAALGGAAFLVNRRRMAIAVEPGQGDSGAVGGETAPRTG